MRKLLALMSALALAIMPYTAMAAILPDVHGAVGGTTSCTLNLTLASGASLWVGAWVEGTTITSVSWNGSEALTNIDSNNTWGSTLITSTWYLANPTSGSHSVTIAFAGTATTCALLGASFTGTAASPQGAHNTRAFAAAGSLSQTVTTTQDNSYIFWFTSNNNSLTLSAGANTTLLDYQRDAPDGTDHGSFYGVATSQTAYTLTEVQTLTTGWQGAIVEIKAASAAPNPALSQVILFGF